MRRNELDYLLNTLLDFNKDVSDILLTVDKPLQVEVSGQLMPVPVNPVIERLTPFQTEMIALNLIAGSQRLAEDLQRTGSCDASYALGDRARFRVNLFSQRGSYSIVLRKLNAQIPNLEDLHLPNVIL
ncbi:MAG TPA: twitching motility protein, partial [Verrucomicrobiae bacterium]|nr:twitching motility protein [Verrucomicrobiae bacterium]